MSDNDKKIGVDAHIPSDTEEFERKVTEIRERSKQPRVSAEKEKLNMELGLLIARLSAYAGFHQANEDQLGSLLHAAFVQVTVTNAHLMEFCNIIGERLNALAETFVRLGEDQLNKHNLQRAALYHEAAKSLEVKDASLLNKAVKSLEDYLNTLQRNFNIEITAKGVTVNEPPNASDRHETSDRDDSKPEPSAGPEPAKKPN